MNKLHCIPIINQELVNFFSSLNRVTVMRNENLRFKVPQTIHAVCPDHRIPKPSATESIDVRKGFVYRIGRQQCLLSWQPNSALVLCFRRDSVNLELYTTGFTFVKFGKGFGGGNKCSPAGTLRWSKTSANGTVFSDRQAHTKLVHGAATKNGSN